MPGQVSLYKVLGVERSASADHIKRAYRKLAKKYHPDANQGSRKAEDIFKKISEAYGVLGNAKKRKTDDNLRANEVGGPRTKPRGQRRSYNDDVDFGRQYQREGPREEPREERSGRAGL